MTCRYQADPETELAGLMLLAESPGWSRRR